MLNDQASLGLALTLREDILVPKNLYGKRLISVSQYMFFLHTSPQDMCDNQIQLQEAEKGEEVRLQVL